MTLRTFRTGAAMALATTAAAMSVSSDLGAQQSADSPWDFFADARFRLEFNDLDNSLRGAPERHRQRMRLRFGANYTLDDQVKVGARMRTGDPTDPRNPHVDIGGGFSSFDLNIDRLFLQYTPDWIDGATVVIGKFGAPIKTNPVYGELVWDMDIQPEGVGVVYDLGAMGPADQSGLVLAQIAVLEQGAGEDLWASLIQWWATHDMGDGNSFNASAAYFYYGDVSPDGNTALAFGGVGHNATNAGGDFISDFGVLDGVLSYVRGAGVLSMEWIKNFRANDAVGDSGFAFGGAWTFDSGDKVFYQFQNIEQDAIFSPVAQDDLLRTTNHSSHVFGWDRKLTEAMSLRVWALASELEEDMGLNDDTEYRIRVDLNLRF